MPIKSKTLTKELDKLNKHNYTVYCEEVREKYRIKLAKSPTLYFYIWREKKETLIKYIDKIKTRGFITWKTCFLSFDTNLFDSYPARHYDFHLVFAFQKNETDQFRIQPHYRSIEDENEYRKWREENKFETKKENANLLLISKLDISRMQLRYSDLK
jgi:hypothetical protein